MHAQEHNATENKSIISPQICAFSTPTPPPGDWLIQYLQTVKLKKSLFFMFNTTWEVKDTIQSKHQDICLIYCLVNTLRIKTRQKLNVLFFTLNYDS